jgi:hypothetical protein
MNARQTAILMAALFAMLSAASAPAGESDLRNELQRPLGDLDLVTGTLGGRDLLSKRVAEVTASLGRPKQRTGTKKFHRLSYGALPSETGRWSLTIIFRPRAGALRVQTLGFAGRALTERRLGRVLRLTPREFERRLLQAYGDHYQVIEPYRCRTRPLRCRGEVVGQENGLTVGYGLLFPRRPESRYITVYLSRR